MFPLRLSFLALFTLLLVSCSPSSLYQYKLNSGTDEFTGNQALYQSYNIAKDWGLGGFVSLNLRKITNEDVEVYGMEVDLWQRDWFFIKRGESLLLLVDGETMTLSGDGSSGNRKVWDADNLQERAYYVMDLSEIEKLANATTIRARLIGDETMEFDVRPEAIDGFKDFRSSL